MLTLSTYIQGGSITMKKIFTVLAFLFVLTTIGCQSDKERHDFQNRADSLAVILQSADIGWIVRLNDNHLWVIRGPKPPFQKNGTLWLERMGEHRLDTVPIGSLRGVYPPNDSLLLKVAKSE